MKEGNSLDGINQLDTKKDGKIYIKKERTAADFELKSSRVHPPKKEKRKKEFEDEK